MNIFHIIITLVLFGFLIALVVGGIIQMSSKEGYEDAEGFHEGQEDETLSIEKLKAEIEDYSARSKSAALRTEQRRELFLSSSPKSIPPGRLPAGTAGSVPAPLAHALPEKK